MLEAGPLAGDTVRGSLTGKALLQRRGAWPGREAWGEEVEWVLAGQWTGSGNGL
jgi:hypothetical protein